MAREQWEYSLRHAAHLAGVSVDTIKRRLRAGDLPHARQLGDAARTWVVPLGDLVAAGFTITPNSSIQAPQQVGDPANARSTVQTTETRLAVAEAVQKVHAEYARTLADLADRAIAALGARAMSRDPGPGDLDGEHAAPTDAPVPHNRSAAPPQPTSARDDEGAGRS